MVYCTALLLACLASTVLGTIVDLDSDSASGLLQPVEVDLAPGQDLGELSRNVLGPYFADRSARSSESGSDGYTIATTFPLANTFNHYFALVHWTGYPFEVLFIVTMTRRSNPTDSCLWRSTDYGKTFTNDTYKFNESNAVIAWYYISPKEGNIVFADIIHNKIFVTEDQGVSFTRRLLKFTPDKITFQSRDAPMSDDNHLSKHILGYDNDRQQLYVSQNLGRNWILLGNNVSRYFWRSIEEMYEAVTAVYYETAINATHAELRVIHEPFLESEPFDHNIGPIDINSTVLKQEYMFVQKMFNWTEQVEYLSPLWVSIYRRPFQQARFPLKSPELFYTVVDASGNQVFMAVYHSKEEINLYTSDQSGLNYSLSLDHIVGPSAKDWVKPRPKFGVHVVKGMDGVFFANQIRQEENATTSLTATFISFDKGGVWRPLIPPAVDRNNKPVLCPSPTCSLHLRLDSDTVVGYSSIVSKDSAVGLLIAQGNVGSSLEENNTLLHVYFSRDGGFTWQEVLDGHWSFSLVALGSIIVMVPKRETRDPIDSLLWSCDEGVTWNEYQFTENQIRFVGMLVEKGEKSRHATIFGYYLGQRFQWLITDLNFTDAVPNQCSAEDYIEWIPTDGRPGGQCLLGAKKLFERRKSDVCCYVDPDYVRPVSKTPCPCAIEDYECDFGFEKNTLNSPCTPIGSFVWPPSPPESCKEGAMYSYTSGYRKVPGDVCVEQQQSPYSPLVKPCPPVAPAGLSIKVNLSTDKVVEGVQLGQSLTFVLTQESGWTESTQYMWDFGDSTTSTTVGLSNSERRVHAFVKSATYMVRVSAWNSAGESQASVIIQVKKELNKGTPQGIVNGNKKSSSGDKKSSSVGLQVGLSLTVLAVVILAILCVLALWWYRRRYNSLQLRYAQLKGVPLPLSLSLSKVKQELSHESDLQELIDDINTY